MVSKMLSFGSFSVSLFFFPEALGGSIIVPFLFWDYNFLCVFIHTHNVYFSQGSWRNKPAGYIHIDNLRRFITEIGSYEYGDQEKSPGMSYASWRTRKMYVCYSVWVWRPELFKILKDVAVKVLHSSLENCIFMSANLNNSAGATGLEKVNFHSNPIERQCQRMLKQPHNCTHLTCKVMFKIQTSPSKASTVREPWTSRCSSWI